MTATLPPPLSPALDLWREGCDSTQPASTLKVSEWAGKHRILSPEASSEPGKLDINRIPYQREPMDSVNDPEVAETVLWWGSQLGKSETVNCILGYHIHADPSPMLMVQPTVELAEEYSKDRIATMIRDTPVLRRLVKDARSRDSGNTVKSKRYPGGSLVLVGANAPAGLAGRPRRVILKDEIDRFPLSAGTEGDPCALADKRAETFPNAVKVSTSTATIKGLSKIEALYAQSDKRKWHVCCPKCRHEFVPMWKDVQWPDGKPEEAYLECPEPACRAHLSDSDRVAMVRAGRWIATAPFKGVRGYWLNGLNTLFRCHKGFKNRLHEFVADFLKAKDGGRETLLVWINTFLAETYEEEAEKIDATKILSRLEEYDPDTLPEQVTILTASADVHRMRIEAEIKGWGKDEESWGVIKAQFDGDTEKDEVWDKLDEFLLRECTREDGVRLKVARAFVDMGHRDKRVLTWCAPRIGRGVYPCRGLNRVGLQVPPLLPAKPSTNNKARIPHWNIGVTVAKTALYDRVSLEVGGPRTMHFPKGYGYDEEYFKQFTAEKRFIKYLFGQPYFIFEKEHSGVRNEALDLNVYNMGALASLFPIQWDKLAANLKKSAPVIRPHHEPAPTPVPATPERAGHASPDQPVTAEFDPASGRITKAPDKPEGPAKPDGPVAPVPSVSAEAQQAAHPQQRVVRPRRPRQFRGFGGGFVKGW